MIMNMNKAEAYKRAFSAALALNIGAVTIPHAIEHHTVAHPPKAKCIRVSPRNETVIAGGALLIHPARNENEQYYLVEGGSPGEVYFYQQELAHEHKTESEKIIDLKGLSKNESYSVSFQDAAPDIMMKFVAEYAINSSSSGDVRVNVEPLVCKL